MSRSLHKRERGVTNSPTPGTKYTCRMSSQERNGRLAYRFSPDPSSVLWNLSSAVQTVPTRGGQVSYATNRTIGPLMITGQLRSRWDFLELGDFVQRHQSESIYKGAALRFVYPERDIDFDVMIMDCQAVGIDSTQAELVTYMLTCAIVGENSDVNIVELSKLADIDLPADVGWIDTKAASEIAWRRVGDYAQISPPGEGDSGGANTPDGGTRGSAPPEERDVSNPNGPGSVSRDPAQRLPQPGDRPGERNPRPNRPQRPSEEDWGGGDTWLDNFLGRFG